MISLPAFYIGCALCFLMGIVSCMAVLICRGHFRSYAVGGDGIDYLELRRAYSPELRQRALAQMNGNERAGTLSFIHTFEELNAKAIEVVMEYVKHHPHCSRKEVFEALQPIYPDYLDAHPVILYLRLEGRICIAWGKCFLPGRENVHVVDDS